MKKIIIVAASVAAVSATPAFAANNDDVDVTVNATVAEECSIEDIGTLNVGTIPIVETPGADALQINGTAKTDTLAWVSCNYTNQMTLSTLTPLTSASTAGLGAMTGSEPFTNQINYKLLAANYGTSPSANSLDQTVRVSRQEKPVHKRIRFEASVTPDLNAGTRPYAADDYTATANVSITTI